MKKLIISFVLLSVSVLNAAIITVDNKVPSAGDYTTLQEAHDAASNGDVIHVYPSGVRYNAITITKSLSIIGTGLDSPSEGMNTTLISGTIIFGAGSNGARIEGFGGDFFITIEDDNITVKRNKLNRRKYI